MQNASTTTLDKMTESLIVLPRGYSDRDIYMAAMLYLKEPKKIVVEDEEVEVNVLPERVKEVCEWANSNMIAMYVFCNIGECVISEERDLQEKVKKIAGAIKVYCEKIGLEIA